MHFQKANFFHNFNPPNQGNYSLREIAFVLEVKTRLKNESLTDVNIVNPLRYRREVESLMP